MAAKAKIKAKNIDDYLAALRSDQRTALEKMRKTIRAAAPQAEECISYQLAAFRNAGKMLVAFGATASHCAFYPMSPSTVEAHKDELRAYDISKGTIRFQPDRPLPAALLRRLVKARIAENAGGTPSVRHRRPSKVEVDGVLASLKRLGNKKTRDDMGPRYGIHADKAFGVPVGKIQQVAKRVMRKDDPASNHRLAETLWATAWYEARMLAAFVDEPQLVTPAQMDRWCKDFDNWAICDTVCFHLFDRTPHALRKVKQWARKKEEFVRRAAFALLACVALHDKAAADEAFLTMLPLVERAAADERNFVKKAVSWALRSIGRRSLNLHEAATLVAERLSASPQPAARWVGRDVLRDLARPMVTRRLAARRTS